MGDQWLIKKKKNLVRIKFHHIKMRLLQFLDVTDFDNEQIYICILTQATTIKCAFLRDKINIIIIRQHKPVS